MEMQIKELLGQLLSHYQDVQSDITSMENLNTNVEKAEVMAKIRETFGRIKQVESQLYPLRDQFLSAGQSFGQDTLAAFEKAATIVSSLIPKVNALEKQALDNREKLAPAIHESVRGMQMQSAYSQYQ